MRRWLVALALLWVAGCGDALVGENQDAHNQSLSDRSMIDASWDQTTLSEDGQTGVLTLSAVYEPSATVTVGLRAANSQLLFSPDQAVFSSSNWQTAQEITVTAKDDTANDDDQTGRIEFTLVTEDPNYQQATIGAVEVAITDNDTRLDELANVKYTVLRSGGSCPSGFSEGYIGIDTDDVTNYDQLTGEVGDTTTWTTGVYLQFCSLTQPSSTSLSDAIATGFAVLRNGGSCPSGMTPGEVVITSEANLNNSATTGDVGDSSLVNGLVTLQVCESTSNLSTATLETADFVLFQNGDCPGSSSEGLITIDTEDSNNNNSSLGSNGDTSIDSGYAYLELCTY